MTLDEAQSEAVQGAWLTADHFGPGTYLSYNFDGWRINFKGGSSSGFSPRDEDRAADWRVCGPEPEPQPAASKWGAPTKRDAWGRTQ